MSPASPYLTGAQSLKIGFSFLCKQNFERRILKRQILKEERKRNTHLTSYSYISLRGEILKLPRAIMNALCRPCAQLYWPLQGTSFQVNTPVPPGRLLRYLCFLVLFSGLLVVTPHSGTTFTKPTNKKVGECQKFSKAVIVNWSETTSHQDDVAVLLSHKSTEDPDRNIAFDATFCGFAQLTYQPVIAPHPIPLSANQDTPMVVGSAYDQPCLHPGHTCFGGKIPS